MVEVEHIAFSLRLGGRTIGRVSALLDVSESLECAKGTLTEAAEKVLGHKVVIKRFMVTIWGRTGYLQPEQESAPLSDCTYVMTSRSAVLDLGIPVQNTDIMQYKAQSPMRRTSSSSSILSACDHFEFYRE